ncbi:hypothetical protein [Paractinoplanes rishiriensis]|uniref:Uncharacterized protein n=1 Tax=Paractinoplanes rishiriensis TaxID=1050105 RepID=A0A919K6V8_9ACTN|nr:hypothetical protein [Actinoplanes rishiriensis]GIF02046.1 hypothetical protein Ari01nite_95100 [Actinoplanes rishiriensis]
MFRARWAAAATVVLTLTGAGLVVATPAHAVPFPLTDDFEGDPASRWVADAVAGKTSVRLGNHNLARSPSKAATLDAGGIPTSTSARIYRTVTPDITTPLPVSCSISLHTRRIRILPPLPDPVSVEVYVKIRSGGPTGRITLARTKVVSATVWERWDVGTMSYPSSAFTIEMATYYGVVLIDDVSFSCIGFP